MALNVMGSKSLYWKTGIDTSGVKKGSTETKGILKVLAGSISKQDVFAGLALSAGVAFAKAGIMAYDFSRRFQTAMKEVQTISTAVQQDYEGISDQIMNLSKRVPDMANQLSNAYYQIVSAGYDGAEGMRLLEASSKLAVAGVTDTFTAADTLTSIMNAYGDRAGTAMEISDKLFTTVKLGKITMSQLGSSLSSVTGLAAQAGLEFNELVSIVAKGTKTMKPEEMIVGVKGILNSIIKGPQQEAEKIIKELGIEFDLTALKTKGFADFMDDLMDKTDGNIETLQKLFPNVRGLTGMLAVATKEGGNFRDILKDMDNSLGATETAFSTMVATADNQTKILGNIINSKLKGLGDSILQSVNQVSGAIINQFKVTGDGYSNNVDRAVGEAVRLKAEFKDVSTELLMLAKNQNKNNSEADRYSAIIQKMNKDFAPYLKNLVTEKDSYLDIADNLAVAKTNLDAYWKAKRKEAVTSDIQKEMDLINKRNALLQYMIDLKEEGLLVTPDSRFYENAKNQTEVWANVSKEIENNNKQIGDLENQYKVAAGAIEETDRSIITIIESLNNATGAVEKTTEAFSNMSGVGGFDIQAPAPLNLTSQKQSLTEIMSLFNQHIEQLEALRQAGVDTTDILNSEWENFANNVKEEYANEPEIYKAVINMKKDAELEYQEWQIEQWKKQHKFQNAILQEGLNAYKQFVTSLIDTDMTGKKRREAIWESIKSGFANMLANMTAKMIENAIITEFISDTASAAAIASATVTGTSVATAWSTAAAMASLATMGGNAVPASAGMISTVSLGKLLAIGSGLNKGGEVLDGSDRNVDSVPVFLTKKEIVINRESAQENKPILLGMNKDKHFISKHFIPKGSFIGRNSGGEIAGSKMNFPPIQSFPSEMKITSTQLDSLIGAVTAQTMNQRQSKSPVININSQLDFEKFIVEMDETRSKMESRGYSR